MADGILKVGTITTSSGSGTITVPSGVTTTLTDGISGDLKFNSGFGSVATAYGVRAWVNFNGTGTVAINASGNISSITDGGTATFTLNFTNNMPDANYAVGTTARQTTSGGTALARLSNSITTSSVILYCVDNSDNPVDPVTVTAIISR